MPDAYPYVRTGEGMRVGKGKLGLIQTNALREGRGGFDLHVGGRHLLVYIRNIKTQEKPLQTLYYTSIMLVFTFGILP